VRISGKPVVALAIAGALLVAACSSSSKSGSGPGPSSTGSASSSGAGSSAASGGSPIKIGALGSFTGAVGAATKSYADGVKIALDATNKSGGIDGHPIDLVTLDDGGDAAKGVANVRTAVDSDHVIGICCGINSAVTGAVAPLLKQFQVPEISIGAPTPDFLDPQKSGNGYFFISGLNAGVGEFSEMIAATPKLLPNVTSPKVGIVGISTPAGQTFMTQAQAAVKSKGWTVSAATPVSFDGTNTEPPAAKLAQSKPDIIFAAVSSTSRLPFFKALKQDGYDGPILLYSSGVDKSILQTLNNPNLYGIVDYNYLDENNAATKLFQSQAKAAGLDATSSLAPSGYAAGLMLAEALKKCGADCTGKTLTTSLEALSGFDGNGFFAGPLKISADNHDAFSVALLVHWASGAPQSAGTVSAQ
jgi:ABC-type branched-subunit amino acid transport system substrate-binding protein